RVEDFPLEGLGGKIALMERGEVTFQEKVHNAQDAGASAAIIYNNEPGNFLGTLATESEIPALSISQAEGRHLLGLLGQGEVVAEVKVIRQNAPSQSVIATKVGLGTEVVVIGAHYDTVAGVAGANDNASGTAVLLTLAQALKDETFPFTLRLIAFGSEEVGLLGSRNYVRSILPDGAAGIRAMLNFDAVGSGDGLATGGDPELVDRALTAAREMGISISEEREPVGATSDHAVFDAAGIPIIYFTGTDLSRVHTGQDTSEFVEVNLLEDAVQLGLSLVRGLSQQ
ncbi:MAG: M28 family metallopeptidase, partial [Dehalococcoidia bacterium]